MKRKEYIEKAKKSILNRVKFHAPIVYDDNIDRTTLAAFKVDACLPIFKFDNVLNKKLVKAFRLAGEEEDFNLLFSADSLGRLKGRHLKKLKNVTIFDKDKSPAAFVQAVNKMNINYQSHSNYNLTFKDKFFKVNGQILNPNFDDFFLRKTTLVDDFFVDYHEFILNGTNFFLKIQNKSKQEKSVNLELNIPLKKGYYYFKRLQKSILVENLLTKEKLQLNFLCRNAKFSFSDVDGLENSVFACLNVKLKLTLSSCQEDFVFFNLGEEKFSLKGRKEIKHFLDLSHKKCCEIFNLKVATKNPKFDYFFNRTLPQKIWINWLNGEADDALEQKYVTLKRFFVKGSQKMDLVNFKEIGLREIGIFNGEYYKKILIIQGEERFLRVGKTFFWNINGITDHSLKSNEPMSVCFGS